MQQPPSKSQRSAASTSKIPSRQESTASIGGSAAALAAAVAKTSSSTVGAAPAAAAATAIQRPLSPPFPEVIASAQSARPPRHQQQQQSRGRERVPLSAKGRVASDMAIVKSSPSSAPGTDPSGVGAGKGNRSNSLVSGCSDIASAEKREKEINPSFSPVSPLRNGIAPAARVLRRKAHPKLDPAASSAQRAFASHGSYKTFPRWIRLTTNHLPFFLLFFCRIC